MQDTKQLFQQAKRIKWARVKTIKKLCKSLESYKYQQ